MDLTRTDDLIQINLKSVADRNEKLIISKYIDNYFDNRLFKQ